jgi:soluble lytic murein transglycosylase-like protein
MRKNLFRVAKTILIMAVFFHPNPCGADIYKYVDKMGIVHITNTPTHSGYKVVIRDKRRGRQRENKYDTIISGLCKKYGVTMPLVKAVIKAESNFNPLAVSKKGAQGLMQLMPKTAKELKVSDPFNPYDNLKGGIQHMSKLLSKYDGNVRLALAAYNAGEEAVSKNNSIPPYRETRNYVKKVMKFRKYYQ